MVLFLIVALVWSFSFNLFLLLLLYTYDLVAQTVSFCNRIVDRFKIMTPTAPGSDVSRETLNNEHLNATSAALDSLTSEAKNHTTDPQQHIHVPADDPRAHSRLRSLIPYSSLEEFENAFHMGNYVMDRLTGKKTFEAMSIYVRVGMHLLYYGSQQEQALHWKRTQDLLKDQSEKMGRQYDTPESTDHIKPFIESFGLANSMAEMEKPDPASYATFNEFFAREIKPSARPIAEPNNPSVVSSPADCRLTAFPTVDLATKYWIKGFGFTLEKLLGNRTLAQKFEGGTIVIARLAPQDYHRWHAPVSGRVQSITEIPGTYYTVNPQAINEPGTLDVFCENRRSVMVVERTGTAAPVAIIAVGAMLVGSIKYNAGIEVGAAVDRGQCLGSFQYGGSTVIVVFPSNEVVLDADLVRNSTESKCETYVKVGWRVGAGPR
nr:phosphatidylserine decarboxylase proenzyme 3 [Quercus suber]